MIESFVKLLKLVSELPENLILVLLVAFALSFCIID